MPNTTNYGWPIPTVAGSAGVWGTILNTLFNLVDSVVFALRGEHDALDARVEAIEATDLVVGTLAARPAEPTVEGERYWARDTDELFIGEDNGGVFSWVEVAQPEVMFRASVYRTTIVPSPSGVPTAIEFDSEHFDIGSCFDAGTSTSRLVVPAVTGAVSVVLTAHAHFTANAGTPSLTLRKNGTEDLCTMTGWPETSHGDTTADQGDFSISLIDDAEAGDYYELVFNGGSSGALNGGATGNGVRFGIARIT